MMLVAGALAVVALAIGVPHLLNFERAPAGLAAAIWLSALLLRGLASLGAAVAAEIYLPMTGLLEPLGTLCADAAGASITGHTATDVLMAIPALAIAGSVTVAIIGLWRASRRVQRLMRTALIGPGPAETVVVADGDLLVAVAGLRRPRLVLSAGALMALDDEELQASLDHERGHIALRHRWLLLTGELARALGRFLPGTRAAARELVFSLERDADRYAIARRNHPAVLVSAICKVARAETPAPPALALGGGIVTRRTRLLLQNAETAAPRPHLGLAALAPLMITLVAASAVALPFAAHASYHHRHVNATAQDCTYSNAA